MRNEELETRLHRQGLKLWSLKQLCLEQQKHIKFLNHEQQSMKQAFAIYREKALDSVLQCKGHYYAISEQMQLSTGYHELFRNIQMARESIHDADLQKKNLQKEVDEQVEQSDLHKKQMDTLEEKNRILETENEHLYERVKKDADNCKRMLLEIFDRVDAKTSKALVNPSIEQLHSLVSAKIEEVAKKVDEKVEEVSGVEQRRWKDLKD